MRSHEEFWGFYKFIKSDIEEKVGQIHWKMHQKKQIQNKENAVKIREAKYNKSSPDIILNGEQCE